MEFELSMAEPAFSHTPLYQAITTRSPKRVLTVLHRQQDILRCDGESQSTYLHLLINIADPLTEDRLVPIVYQLANAGVDVNAVDYRGRTVMDLALQRGLHDMLVALIRIGVDTSEKEYKELVEALRSPFQLQMLDTLDKFEPGLWEAVRRNNTAMVHMLLNSWCRVNIHKDGVSLIQYAQGTHKSDELIQTLEDFEVTLEFVHATMAGDERRMFEFLMDSKPVDPYIMDISHQDRWSSPLSPRSLRDTAKAMGHSHILHLLPEDGEDTLEINCNNNTPAVEKKPAPPIPKPRLLVAKVQPQKPQKPTPAKRASLAKKTSRKESMRKNNKPQNTDDDNNLPDAFTHLNLDLGPDEVPMNYATPCEPSSLFTGSVRVKAVKRSRKQLNGAYAYHEPQLYGMHGIMDEESDGHLDHIATPRGRPQSNAKSTPSESDHSHHYSSNWLLASLRSAPGRAKNKTKEIKSKLCVIQ